MGRRRDDAPLLGQADRLRRNPSLRRLVLRRPQTLAPPQAQANGRKRKRTGASAANGRIVRDYVAAQDQVAWVIQGPVSDRTTERLGVTDVGVIMYRRMLDEQIAVVEDGGEPMNVRHYYPGYEEMGGPFRGNVPRKPDVEAALSGAGARLSEWEGVETTPPSWGKQTDSGGTQTSSVWYSDGRKH